MSDSIEPCRISVVIPVYGSALAVPELIRRLVSVLAGTTDEFEIVLVDDGSPEETWSTLTELFVAYPQHLRCIQLMRNFGQHNAIMCGFSQTTGQYIITMDDDLQHEPEAIPLLIKAISESNSDVVYGAFESKKHGFRRNLGSKLVNSFFKLIFQTKVTVTPLRIIRRELMQSILRYDLNFTFIDGLLAWNTRRISEVKVPHHERQYDKSSYSIGKLLTLAMNVFSNFSLLPLQLVSLMGVLSSSAGLLLGLCYLFLGLMSKIEVPGYASTIVAVLTLGGLQLLSLGIIGEYLGRLHMNVNKKPQYTVRRVVGKQYLT